jgi:hypothetical protein
VQVLATLPVTARAVEDVVDAEAEVAAVASEVVADRGVAD